MRTPTMSRSLAVLAATAVAAATVVGTAATAQAASARPSQAAAAQAPAPPPAAGNCPTTAAQKYGWGDPTRRSDFDGTTVPPDWHPYGPEPGHARKGTRTPEAVTVGDGAMSIKGTEDGTTGAVSWHPGQQYGRWESCVRSDKGNGGLNALLLMWPVKENFPVGGEIDWMEISDDARQKTDFFLHYGESNDQDTGSVEHDATQWSAWALEWTPEKITGYVNGKEWYSTTDTEQFPPGAMNMTMQLDYFGDAGGPAAMHMDWAKQWALPQSKPATLTLPPGAPATGQPRSFPDRKPRALDGSAPAPEEPADDASGEKPADDTSDEKPADTSGDDKPADKSGDDKAADTSGDDQAADKSGDDQAADTSGEKPAQDTSSEGAPARERTLHPTAPAGAEAAPAAAAPRERTLHPAPAPATAPATG